MAGDWIKMRGSLATHPKVLQIAKIIATDTEVGRRLTTGFNGALSEIVTRDVTRDVTLASLFRVWCACNEHTSDGVWRGIDIDDLDQIAGVPGFGAAMARVGWAVPDPEAGTVTFPNFLEYNAPAKNGGRSSAAARQRRYRERQKSEDKTLQNNDQSDTDNGVSCDVTRDVTDKATRDVTSDVEKRREESKKKPPVSFVEDDMRLAEFMFEHIRQAVPEFKPRKLEPWANTIRLMRERDDLSHRRIAEVFLWANRDSFWKTNILSPDKLREKFPQLAAKREENHAGNQRAVGQSRSDRNDQALRDYFAQIDAEEDPGGDLDGLVQPEAGDGSGGQFGAQAVRA